MIEKITLTGKNLTIAKRLLRDAAKILEKSNVQYSLEAGTLLGLVRENRLIPWDDDMDMSIAETRYIRLQILAWKFRFRGYWARVRRVKRDLPSLKSGVVRVLRIRNRRFRIIAGLVKLDIFIRHPAKDGYYWIQGYTGTELMLFTPKKYFEPSIINNYLVANVRYI